MERKQITMMVVAASGKKGLAIGELRKVLNLLRELRLDVPADFYGFTDCCFGHCCLKLHRDISILGKSGLIKTVHADGEAPSLVMPTRQGLAYGRRLAELDPKLADHVARVLGLMKPERAEVARARTTSSFHLEGFGGHLPSFLRALG